MQFNHIRSVTLAGAGGPTGPGGGADGDGGGGVGVGGGTMVISCQVARPSTIELPAATGFDTYSGVERVPPPAAVASRSTIRPSFVPAATISLS